MTKRVVATVSLSDGLSPSDRGRVCEALTELASSVPELSHSHAGLHIDGSVGGGDVTWDFAVPDARALTLLTGRLETEGWAALFSCPPPDRQEVLSHVASIEAWLVAPLSSNVSRVDLVGIKRTNLLHVLDSATPEAIERWTQEQPILADRVPAIRNWSLARVEPIGPTRPRVHWTHAWEQEFETLEGLTEDYMASPYHWGYFDGWYDAEMSHCIMDPDLAHLYCPTSESVLSWAESGPA